MNLKKYLREFTADKRFDEGRTPGFKLRLVNFEETDLIRHYYQPHYSWSSTWGWIPVKVQPHCRTEVETWLGSHAFGKFRIEENPDSIMLFFSRETDAAMYKLGGPYA